MTFTCESAVLAKALRDIVAIVPRGNAMEILSNVLIEASDGKVRVTTTNLDMMATRTFPADVTETVATTVDANRLSSVTAALPEGSQAKVTIGEQVTLVAARSRYRFGTLPATSYPPMPFDPSNGIEFEAGEDFLNAITRTRHASSGEISQPAYTGVCLENDASEFVSVATDGKRMAVAAILERPEQVFKVNVPPALADMATKLGADTNRSIIVRLTDKVAQFDFGDTILTGKLLIDPFPAWRRIMPASSSRTVRVHGPAVIQALRRVALVTDDKARRIYFTLSDGKMTLANAGRDEAVEEVPCDFTGEGLTIWFSNPYLRDALTALDADEVTIYLNGERDPAKLEAPTREGVTMIVMPQMEGAKQ